MAVTDFDEGIVPSHTISMSRMSLWQQCRRKWAFKYIYKVKVPTEPRWAVVGRRFAKARELIDTGIGLEFQTLGDLTPGERAKMRAVLGVYEESAREPVDSEIEVRRRLSDGVEILGFVDAITPDRKEIIEWKYTASPSDYTFLKIQMQAATYLACVPEARTFVLITARKPSLRPRKNETIEEFEERVKKDVQNDVSGYFVRKTYPRKAFDTEGAMRHMLKLHKESQQSVGMGDFPPCLNSECNKCEHAEYCSSHVFQVGCSRPDCGFALCQQIALTKGK